MSVEELEKQIEKLAKVRDHVVCDLYLTVGFQDLKLQAIAFSALPYYKF